MESKKASVQREIAISGKHKGKCTEGVSAISGKQKGKCTKGDSYQWKAKRQVFKGR